ncbi:MAG: sugar phosphate isomerase/epimerase [Actinobacteria bacterium]|nr:sugar phosphate isomerase/epimerase [Actinomycetota bacterium]
MPVDGIEILVTRRMVGSLKQAVDKLGASSIRCPTIHGPKRVGAALPSPEAVVQLDEAAWFAAAIGAREVVLHLWDLPESDTDLAGRLDAVVIAADLADKHGVRMLIETIPCQASTPLRNIQRVLEREPRVGVALDTEFLAIHNELEEAFASDWLWADGHVRHVHIKDYDGNTSEPDGTRRYLMPGDGLIDFPSAFKALEDRGFSGAVSLEAANYLDDGRPDIESASRALARMAHSPWSFS